MTVLWSTVFHLSVLLVAACGQVKDSEYSTPVVHKYEMHHELMSWGNAREECLKGGADLVVINSNEESNELRRWLKKQGLEKSHDRRYKAHAGYYVKFGTVLGQEVSPIVLDRWGPDEPRNALCGEVDQDGWLTYSSCSLWKPFVCEYNSSASPYVLTMNVIPSAVDHTPSKLFPPNLPAGCKRAPGWNSFYKMVKTQALPWDAAKRSCEKECAHLAIIDTQAEVDALIEFIAGARPGKLYFGHYFVGAFSTDAVTVQGEPVSAVGYTRWDNSLTKWCLTVDRRMFFYTVPCSRRYDYICEKNDL